MRRSRILLAQVVAFASLFPVIARAQQWPFGYGAPNILGLPGAIPLEGGLPLVVGGKIIGAIGVSGATSQQDGICAKAGAEVLGPLPLIPAASAAATPAPGGTASEPPKK